jgi:nucleoside-diphosphate-sugar epimerase
LIRRSSRLSFIEYLGLEWALGDVSDPDSLDTALEGIDGVIHCAGLTKAASREDYFLVNERGTQNLFAACAKRSAIRKIVHISSLAAFGPSTSGDPVTELATPHPVSDYGRSKLAAQREAESWSSRLPVGIVVPPAVYGPNDPDFLIYFKWVGRRVMPLVGRAPRRVSVVFAPDLGEAVSQVLLSECSTGRTYFVEDGQVQTWSSVAEAIGRAMARAPKRICIPVSAARGLGAMGDLYTKCTGKAAVLSSQKIGEFLHDSWTCSARRIRDELGFCPQFTLDLGIQATLAWYRNNGWLHT